MKWLGHVIRMDQTREAKNNFESKPEGRRPVCRSRCSWLEGDGNDMTAEGKEMEAEDRC